MATTTNYGWATPDDTDLVKDGAAAIRTLGSSIDTSFVADEGDLLVGGTSDIFEALPIGAAGTVLTSDGDTAEWVAPAGGGKVLQVIHAETGTSTNITSTSYTDTGLSATITPTLATSSILVIYNQMADVNRQTFAAGGSLQLLRASTSIQDLLETVGIFIDNGAQVALTARYGATYLDSPATTSATTYKIQGKVNTAANSNTLRCQYGNALSTMTLMEIGA